MVLTLCLSISAAFAQHPPLGGGEGTNENPYQIKTIEHFAALATYVNAGHGNETTGIFYKLMNNLNFDVSPYNTGVGWEPVGFMSEEAYEFFKGNFDGNGKVVRNLFIARPTEMYIGLFGGISGATLTNLGVEACNIVGYFGVGGLVGLSENNTTIENCYTTGSVSGNGVNSPFIGGLVGYHYSSVITHCYAHCNVNGEEGIGGLVGYNWFSRIANCYATGNVTGKYLIGGLVGDNYSSTIANCYATCSVSGDENTGGLVGANGDSNSTIENCYATGSVNGREYAGGLVGRVMDGTIKNCVAANNTVAATAANANVNRVTASNSGTLINNYANLNMIVKIDDEMVEITGDLNTQAGANKTIEELKEEQFYTMKENWADSAWNFINTWKICKDTTLPYLLWQNIDCENVGIEPLHVTHDALQVYPNPTTGEFQVKNNELLQVTNIEVYDVYGRKLLSHTAYRPHTTLDISHLQTGTYFVKITTDVGEVIKKVVKQ